VNAGLAMRAESGAGDGMMGFASGTRVYLSCALVNMRKGFDGLSAEVATVIKMDPYCGHLFVFRGKRGDYVKVLYWDGSGLCLYAKRLEKGRFVWPPIVNEQLHLTRAQLALLIEGIDWRTVAAAETQRPMIA
jgi:transposase